jgi:hypothetical protein
MKPKSFDNYSTEIHPPWDSVVEIDGKRYRLIQQCPTESIWDVSTTGQFLGRIQWLSPLKTFAIVNVNRVWVGASKRFPQWEDAVVELKKQVEAIV